MVGVDALSDDELDAVRNRVWLGPLVDGAYDEGLLRAEHVEGLPQEDGQTQSRLYKGEIGEWEGVRFIENPRTRKANDGAASATSSRIFLSGSRWVKSWR